MVYVTVNRFAINADRIFKGYIKTIIPIKECKSLTFTNEYDKDALLMIPAAYTNEDGTIQGEYRIDGKTLRYTLTQGENIASSCKGDCHIWQLAF